MSSPEDLSSLIEDYELDQQYFGHLDNDREAVTELWPPQIEALDNGLLESGNFLVVSPPGTGKTLLGEMRAVHTWFERGRSSVYLVPYRALANEKAAEFDRTLGEDFGLNIQLVRGHNGPDVSDLMDSQIVVMTYERFDHYMRNDPGYIDELGGVIIDEFHKIADPNRGPNLEVVITKLLDQYTHIDITGLSATIPNVEEVADWLSASYADRRDWRHNELHEGMFICDQDEIIFYNDGDQIEPEPVERRRGLDHKQNTVIDFLERASQVDGSPEQALVFAPKRSMAEGFAHNLRGYIEENRRSTSIRLSTDEQIRLADQLNDVPGSEYDSLAKLAKRSIAYHHAGVSSGQKELIEEAFRDGDIQVLVATSTLAAGINLPIKRVFILEPRYGGQKGRRFETFEYKNLAGRAGRPSHTNEPGETVLFANTKVQARPRISEYIQGEVDPLDSVLDIRSEHGLFLHLISEYGSVESLLEFLDQALIAHGANSSASQIGDDFGEVFDTLRQWGMIDTGTGDGISLTPLGEATANQLISPASVNLLHKYVQGASEVDVIDLLTVVVASPEFDEGNRLWLDNTGYFPDRNERRDNLDLGRLGNEEMDNAIATAEALGEWIDGTDLASIYTEAGIDTDYWGPADLIDRVVPEAARILESCADILKEAEPELAEEHSTTLERIAGRVRHGVPDEQLELVLSSTVASRKEAEDVATRLDITSPEDVLEMELEELSDKVGNPRARSMYRNAAYHCHEGERRERELLRVDVHEAGNSLSELNSLLEVDQKDFEQSCLNLLERVDQFQVEDVDDESGHTTDPEFYIRLENEDGFYRFDSDEQPVLIGVECKTTEDLDGEIRVEDAMSVVRKANDADIQITVGNPAFGDDAKAAAKDNEVLLLPATAFATLVTTIRSNQYDLESIVKVLRSEGVLTRSEVQSTLNQ